MTCTSVPPHTAHLIAKGTRHSSGCMHVWWERSVSLRQHDHDGRVFSRLAAVLSPFATRAYHDRVEFMEEALAPPRLGNGSASSAAIKHTEIQPASQPFETRAAVRLLPLPRPERTRCLLLLYSTQNALPAKFDVRHQAHNICIRVECTVCSIICVFRLDTHVLPLFFPKAATTPLTPHFFPCGWFADITRRRAAVDHNLLPAAVGVV